MRRFLVRRLFLFLLPALVGCGLTEVLEPDVVDGEPEIREFEEAVLSVDLDERVLTLMSGTVVQVADETEREPDEWGRTFNLAEVRATGRTLIWAPSGCAPANSMSSAPDLTS